MYQMIGPSLLGIAVMQAYQYFRRFEDPLTVRATVSNLPYHDCVRKARSDLSCIGGTVNVSAISQDTAFIYGYDVADKKARTS
jgi:hypothetical protein